MAELTPHEQLEELNRQITQTKEFINSFDRLPEPYVARKELQFFVMIEAIRFSSPIGKTNEWNCFLSEEFFEMAHTGYLEIVLLCEKKGYKYYGVDGTLVIERDQLNNSCRRRQCRLEHEREYYTKKEKREKKIARKMKGASPEEVAAKIREEDDYTGMFLLVCIVLVLVVGGWYCLKGTTYNKPNRNGEYIPVYGPAPGQAGTIENGRIDVDQMLDDMKAEDKAYEELRREGLVP